MSFRKCKDLVLGVAMLLFSGFYLFYAQQIQTRPKLTPSYASAQIVPTLLGVLLAALAVICIVQGVRKLKAPVPAEGEADNAAGKGDIMAVVLTFAVIIGYMMVLSELGFCLSTILYLFLQMLILAPREKRNYLLFALVAIVFTAIVFVAFRIGLQQLLPRGIIESLLGY